MIIHYDVGATMPRPICGSLQFNLLRNTFIQARVTCAACKRKLDPPKAKVGAKVHHVGYSRHIGFASCGAFTEDMQRTADAEKATCGRCRNVVKARKAMRK